MKHSNFEQLEREKEYAEVNKKFLASRRPDFQPENNDSEKKSFKSRFNCCLLVFILVLAALSLIYYFVSAVEQTLSERNPNNNSAEQSESPK